MRAGERGWGTLPMTMLDPVSFGRSVIEDEGRALAALAESLDAPFAEAVDILLGMKGKLIVAGLGKSGHIGRKSTLR